MTLPALKLSNLLVVCLQLAMFEISKSEGTIVPLHGSAVI